jgi:hypothetical protein
LALEATIEEVEREVGVTRVAIDTEQARVEADAQKWSEKLKT